MTPFEKCLGRKPNLASLYEFGVTCSSHIRNASKLEKRAQQGQYIGQDTHSPASLIYHEDKNVVVKARSVTYFSQVPGKEEDDLAEEEDEEDYLQFPIVAPREEESSPVPEGEIDIGTVESPKMLHSKINNPVQPRNLVSCSDPISKDIPSQSY